MSSDVHRWMADYTVHLQAGVTALSAGTAPDAEWLQRCQDFDDQLRGFGGDAIGQAANVDPGHDLMTRLRQTQASLDAACAGLGARLHAQLEAMSRGRKGLKGYDDVGRRMTEGSALYLERRY